MFWELLGISPTKDIRAIKRAYAEKLRLHHPEDDPEGFQNLHEAYRAALEYAGRNGEDETAAKQTALSETGEVVPAFELFESEEFRSAQVNTIMSADEEALKQFAEILLFYGNCPMRGALTARLGDQPLDTCMGHDAFVLETLRILSKYAGAVSYATFIHELVPYYHSLRERFAPSHPMNRFLGKWAFRDYGCDPLEADAGSAPPLTAEAKKMLDHIRALLEAYGGECWPGFWIGFFYSRQLGAFLDTPLFMKHFLSLLLQHHGERPFPFLILHLEILPVIGWCVQRFPCLLPIYREQLDALLYPKEPGDMLPSVTEVAVYFEELFRRRKSTFPPDFWDLIFHSPLLLPYLADWGNCERILRLFVRFSPLFTRTTMEQRILPLIAGWEEDYHHTRIADEVRRLHDDCREHGTDDELPDEHDILFLENPEESRRLEALAPRTYAEYWSIRPQKTSKAHGANTFRHGVRRWIAGIQIGLAGVLLVVLLFKTPLFGGSHTAVSLPGFVHHDTSDPVWLRYYSFVESGGLLMDEEGYTSLRYNANGVDLAAGREDGGLDLYILKPDSVNASPESQKLLLEKVDQYLHYVTSGAFREDFPHADRKRITIIFEPMENASELMRILSEKNGARSAEIGVTFVVRAKDNK